MFNPSEFHFSEVTFFQNWYFNPQYDNRLFIVHENCKLRIPAEHVSNTNCYFCFVLTFRTILRASEKDLPLEYVPHQFISVMAGTSGLVSGVET